jgi:hypothetical protein
MQPFYAMQRGVGEIAGNGCGYGVRMSCRHDREWALEFRRPKQAAHRRWGANNPVTSLDGARARRPQSLLAGTLRRGCEKGRPARPSAWRWQVDR